MGEITKANHDTENLCDSCEYCFTDCCAEHIEFGNGIGRDNVIECDCYSGSEY